MDPGTEGCPQERRRTHGCRVEIRIREDTRQAEFRDSHMVRDMARDMVREVPSILRK